MLKLKTLDAFYKIQAPMMSFQCSFLVIRVADTGIQKKEWRHESSLLLLSFQCLTLESSLYYAATYLKLSFLDPRLG
ncbi:hypothetical protein [Wolbachia endosymbiont (group A) of Brachyopa scutellaris]|uniref:hypothetical protein n=1 Tax=Wolbachia endosymbiont (group A) of Brachyopa scutellaris TaxID=3066140 RepID=UPI003132C646